MHARMTTSRASDTRSVILGPGLVVTSRLLDSLADPLDQGQRTLTREAQDYVARAAGQGEGQEVAVVPGGPSA